VRASDAPDDAAASAPAVAEPVVAPPVVWEPVALADAQLVARPADQSATVAAAQERINLQLRLSGTNRAFMPGSALGEAQLVRAVATEVRNFEARNIEACIVYIRVFGDPAGQPASSLSLSIERAAELHQQLVAAGLAPARIVTVGCGRPPTEGRRRNDAKLHVQFL
jgi:outer membrane protein OmpA-like peptidoglycan-associated protein